MAQGIQIHTISKWTIVWWAITDIRAISCSRAFALAFSSCRTRIFVLSPSRPRVIAFSPSGFRNLALAFSYSRIFAFSSFRHFALGLSLFPCEMSISRGRNGERARAKCRYGENAIIWECKMMKGRNYTTLNFRIIVILTFRPRIIVFSPSAYRHFAAKQR